MYVEKFKTKMLHVEHKKIFYKKFKKILNQIFILFSHPAHTDR